MTGVIVDSLGASIMAFAPKLAAASPTSAAASAGVGYLLVRHLGSDESTPSRA